MVCETTVRSRAALVLFAVGLSACGGGGGGEPAIPPYWVHGGIVATDLNGDGRLDVAVAATYVDGPPPHAGHVEVYLGSPGGFGGPVRHPVGPDPWGLSVGDIDGDGHPDLLVATPMTLPPQVGVASDDGLVAVLRQDAAHPGDFLAAQQLATGGVANDAVAADVSGDARADVIVADGVIANGRLLLLQQDGTGGFGAPVSQPVAAGWGSSDATVADVDGDGLPDLVLAAGQGVAVLYRLPQGGLSPARLLSAGATVSGVAAGDLDGDGRVDIVAAGTAGSVTILRQTSPGQFVATTHAVAQGMRRVAIGDLDGDGVPDVAGVALVYQDLTTPARVSVLLQSASQPGSFAPAATYDGGANSDFIAIADVNGDGSNDVLLNDGPVFLPQIAATPGRFGLAQPLR